MRDIVNVLLAPADKIEVVGQQEDQTNLSQILKWEEIDVLLIGINKNDAYQPELKNAIELCRDIRSNFPAIKIILHSAFSESRNICQLMNAGADAVVSKTMGYEELLKAIYKVKEGRRYLTNETCHFFKNAYKFLQGLTHTLVEKEATFTRREQQVLSLVSIGRTNKEIAEQLCISYKTVETHRKNLLTKAKAKNTAELIAFSYSHSLL